MKQQDYVFGANIIENLTTGMYKNSKVIFREYIQNACDAIDKAVEQGILKDRKDGRIEIFIEAKDRYIEVRDNATGISKDNFVSTLADVANSSKKLGEDRGFRGIGRLAGLAYCDRLVFTSSFKGENVKSVMVCDAALMRKMLNENVQGKKYTAQEILKNIYSFSEEPEDKAEHYFVVEMQGVTNDNQELLKEEDVRDYLSFVAPVPFYNNFYLRTKIYEYAKQNNYKIDEYNIKVNETQIVKPYKMNYLTHGKQEDSIRDIEFFHFPQENTGIESLAWGWIGRSDFRAAIPENCAMRGIRIRVSNIQIGDEKILQPFFKEARGVNYFVGEIYVLTNHLIPNSQRDYFNENTARVLFEKEMKIFATNTLNQLYRRGSDFNSYIKTLREADEKEKKFKEKCKKGLFLGNKAEEQKEQRAVDTLKVRAKEAHNKLQSVIQKEADSQTDKIIAQIAKDRLDNYQKEQKEKQAPNKSDSNKNKKNSGIGYDKGGISNVKSGQSKRLTDNLARLNKNQRKLIERAYCAIRKVVTDDELFERIVKSIEDEFK